MAVFLSPGVFPREINLPSLPSATSPIRPAFVGTAKKGPMNTPVFISNSAQYIDTFGEPVPESNLGYAVLAYLEEGNSCYIMRVGVECEDGQPAALDAVCIDTSGSRSAGWGRIPLFTGIDYGRINLRSGPYVFHSDSISSPVFNDAAESPTEGPTAATVTTGGSYTGAIDDSYVLIVTSPATSSPVAGATYEVIRNSDGELVDNGTFTDAMSDGNTQTITIDGFTIQIEVTSGSLGINDTITWSVAPDNLDFSISVDGGMANSYSMNAATLNTVEDFITAANGLLSSEDYIFVAHTLDDGVTVVPQIRSTVAGQRVQVTGTAAWCLEMGIQQYAWDIPRSNLLGLDAGPYTITNQNNRVRLNLIGDDATQEVEFSLPNGVNQSVTDIAAVVDAAGVVAGDTLWNAYALTVPGGTQHLVIETSANHRLDTIELLANYSHLKTLRFAEEVNITYPYKRSYRGFNDNRTLLPSAGESTASVPLSCELNNASDECASDTAYFQNIVGWLVAPSAGTWVEGITVSLELFTEGLGDSSGRYKLTLRGSQNEVLDVIDNVSFDKRADRYIGNVVNPESRYGGTAGNPYVNWEERPAFLDNDTNLPGFEVRLPSQFLGKNFIGMANGIPLDPVYSGALDSAIIGNPATATGLYAFQNPETVNINLLVTPGFSSGAVIGTALQICEARGDVLYLVDPPFGLRPQQVVDWHNGMLLSDLSSAINSSYGALYYCWMLVHDQFSRDDIWIPPSGHVAAAFARTAREAQIWSAPAGSRRGRIQNVKDLEYAPTRGEQDLLYGSGNAVNPIINFPNRGITIWGQRTLNRSDELTDRVNVRMLLNEVKRLSISILQDFIFEPNDRVLWKQVKASLDPVLADIQSRRGLNGYQIIVDATNNTPERNARGELWVSIILMPTTVAEFVALNIVTMRSGASFSAEEAIAAAGAV